MGLDTLLTKIAASHTFHNFSSDLPYNASHKTSSKSSQELLTKLRLKIGLKKLRKNWGKYKQYSIRIISIALVATIPTMPHMKFEVNRTRNFRGDSI